MNFLYSFPLSCMENASCKTPTFLRKLTVLFVVVIIYKEADIVLITYVTLLHSTAKKEGCRKLASRHSLSVTSLFPFSANFLKFVVKMSYANTFEIQVLNRNVFAFRADFCEHTETQCLV